MTLPAPTAEAHFPNEGSSAGAARRFVASSLRTWGLDDLEEVACLLVSELASNVVLHAGTELDVHLRRVDGRVRVEVHDGSPRLPEMKLSSTTATTGRGLIFVAELAQAWGSQPLADGKVVWFELDEAGVAIAAPQAAADLRLAEWDDGDDVTPGAVPGGGPEAGPGGADAPASSSGLLVGT